LNKKTAILKNTAGSDGVDIADCTGTIRFANLTFDSQNVAAFSNMIHISGTTTNTCDVTLENVAFGLEDAGAVAGDGDYGIKAESMSGQLVVMPSCSAAGGKYGVYTSSGAHVEIGGEFNEQLGLGARVDAAFFTIEKLYLTDMWGGGIYAGGNTIESWIQNNRVSLVDDAHADNIECTLIQYSASSVRVNVLSNILKAHTSRAKALIYGIAATGSDHSIIDENNIDINISSDRNTYGIAIFASDEVIIGANNQIKIDNDDTTSNHYGIYVMGF